MTLRHRHGGMGQQFLVFLAEPLAAAVGLVLLVVVDVRHGPSGRLDFQFRQRHGVVDQFPGDLAIDVDLLHVAIGFHHLRNGGGHAGLVDRLHGNHQSFAVGANRIDVIGDHRDPLAEAGHEILLDVDLRAVGILLEGCDHVVKHPLVADDVVDERFSRFEGGLHVPLHRGPAGHVAGHPGRRR